MRRFGLTTIGIATALLSITASLAARPSGFYLGGHYYRESPEQGSRRLAPVASVPPMPVPRPHFFNDDAPPAEPESERKALETKPVVSKPVVSKPGESEPAEAKPVEPTHAEAPGPKAPSLTVPVGQPPAAAPTEKVANPTPPLRPPKPAEIVAPFATPPTSKPAVAPSGANTVFVPRSPDDDPACPGRLTARGVVADTTSIGPQPDERCTVVQPLRLTSLALPGGGTVEFPDRPTIACTTADVFSLYVRDLLSPLAKGSYGTPVSMVWTGPGLECRSRDHIFGAKLSAHGQGLAIDIAQLKLADGRTIAVGDPKTETDNAFETAARAGACGYFHTVLGPGSDIYHRTHWHFDLEVRGSKGDAKYCK